MTTENGKSQTNVHTPMVSSTQLNIEKQHVKNIVESNISKYHEINPKLAKRFKVAEHTNEKSKRQLSKYKSLQNSHIRLPLNEDFLLVYENHDILVILTPTCIYARSIFTKNRDFISGGSSFMCYTDLIKYEDIRSCSLNANILFVNSHQCAFQTKEQYGLELIEMILTEIILSSSHNVRLSANEQTLITGITDLGVRNPLTTVCAHELALVSFYYENNDKEPHFYSGKLFSRSYAPIGDGTQDAHMFFSKMRRYSNGINHYSLNLYKCQDILKYCDFNVTNHGVHPGYLLIYNGKIIQKLSRYFWEDDVEVLILDRIIEEHQRGHLDSILNNIGTMSWIDYIEFLDNSKVEPNARQYYEKRTRRRAFWANIDNRARRALEFVLGTIVLSILFAISRSCQFHH